MPHFQPSFRASIAAVRVRFGAGTRRELGDEIRELGHGRALLLSTPEQAESAEAFAAELGDLAVGVFSGAAMHTPVTVSEEATERAVQAEADCVVSIGGGSATGLGKAVALRTGLPLIAVPTTCAGSEATPILGQSEGGRKVTLNDPKVRPVAIVYDPELLLTLPVPATVASGLNAIAHAAEALYARDRNPVATALAVQGLKAFRSGLPKTIARPDDIDARGETLYGAWLCGTVLGQVGMALHHKLCHALGGGFDLPHAETHAVILPHAIAFNFSAAQELLEPLNGIFGGPSPGRALRTFAEETGAPLALKDFGLARDDLDRAADLAAEKPYWNPRPVGRDDVRALLQAAWEGAPPIE